MPCSNGFLGCKHSEATKLQISMSMRGRKLSLEHRAKISASMRMNKERIRPEVLELWKKGYSLDEAKEILRKQKEEELLEQERIKREQELQKFNVFRDGLTDEDVNLPQLVLMEKYNITEDELKKLIRKKYLNRRWLRKYL